MATDFFDDDLLRPDVDPASVRGPGERAHREETGPTEVHKLARHQGEISNQVAGTASEIEMLRRRQDALEKERKELESLARKQEEYEQGKKAIIEGLTTSIVGIEKDEVQATRMAELLGETRARFSDLLAELRGIDEDTWAEADFVEELNRGLALVRNAQSGHRKALARIEAAGWHKGTAKTVVQEQIPRELGPRKGFGYWVKVGIAVSLVPVAVAIAMFVAWIVLSGV